MYQQHMLLKLKKPILKYTLNKYHVHWLSCFKHLKLPISIKMANCLFLHDSDITKFDFMKYIFAKLMKVVLAWKYVPTSRVLAHLYAELNILWFT